MSIWCLSEVLPIRTGLCTVCMGGDRMRSVYLLSRSTVEPQNKGHFEDDINLDHLFFIERFSSL